MSKVRARFKCHSVSEFETQKEVTLSPDFKGNEDFSKYTPGGQFKMIITQDTPAFDYFKPGKVYSILIEEEVAQ